MLKEIAVFCLLLVFAYCTEHLHRWWNRRAERKRAQGQEEDDALGPISPLPNLSRGVLHSVVVCCSIAVVNPTATEAAKHYIVHFLIYSGYVIKSH